MKRLVATVAALLGAAGLLAGCQKVVKSASTSVSPCFRVLPEAHAAVGGQGKFVDVARVQGRRVTRLGTVPGGAPESTTTTLAPGRRDVCLVAYSGTFDPAKIQHLIGARQQGKYAIVIVGVQARAVRGVLLTEQLPKPLHAH